MQIELTPLFLKFPTENIFLTHKKIIVRFTETFI